MASFTVSDFVPKGDGNVDAMLDVMDTAGNVVISGRPFPLPSSELEVIQTGGGTVAEQRAAVKALLVAQHPAISSILDAELAVVYLKALVTLPVTFTL